MIYKAKEQHSMQTKYASCTENTSKTPLHKTLSCAIISVNFNIMFCIFVFQLYVCSSQSLHSSFMNTSFENFNKWARLNDIEWEGITFVYSPYSRVGIRASSYIPKEFVFLKIPFNSMLCGPSISDFISNEKQTCIEDENLDSNKNITILADLGSVGQTLELKLINEYVLGNISNMYPWITIMPNITDYASHLYTWGKREKKRDSKKSKGYLER